MGRDGALREQDRLVGIDAAGDQRGRHLAHVRARSSPGSISIGQRVKVGEEEQALGLVLHPHPAQDRAEQIAEMQVAGRLDAGNDAHRAARSLLDLLAPQAGSAMSSLSIAAADPGERRNRRSRRRRPARRASTSAVPDRRRRNSRRDSVWSRNRVAAIAAAQASCFEQPSQPARARSGNGRGRGGTRRARWR